ncbi:hypothetical protein [Pelotalea chapellei]|uniref:Uncharacterized protein n=1 Tax=Pelotalea chapellei TaxID=44671 RepID=A0ABS5UAR0_9BACT|nr:hypothetical protein [Pelotalea chapellei]MBT1072768.1 hypothetical protein [Pelotalea chapellei]
MQDFFRNGLICCLVVLLPATVIARSNKDADAVVTLRDDKPCFSYPKDEEILKRPYSFSYLGVSKNTGGVVWEIQITSYERKGLIEPNSPENCIGYGIVNPGMKEDKAAKQLLPDLPYHVFISVAEAPGGRNSYDRKFALDFCISNNEKGEPIILGASGDGKGMWHCLKPGETRKRGFWGWLFGK